MKEVDILYDKIIEMEEEIATLRAENLELRMEEEDETEPYRYAQAIIDNNDYDTLAKMANWHNEVAEYLEVYVGYHTENGEDDE